ncbi:MAG: Gfo/Idh/MocA family oxidoreductase [Spirochaetes bacterium]|nr:Gfo/Idh/MocA family oxidoreductase [Spirochaetota bacterium]
MSEVRVGIVGGGMMAQAAHIPCLAAMKNVRLEALCEPRADLAASLAAKWHIPKTVPRLDELLSLDLDAVLILTRVELHKTQVLQALRAGKHVFVEKPLAMSAASIDEILPIAKASGKVLRVGTMKRHDRNVKQGLAKLAAGNPGKLLHARMSAFIGAHWDARLTATHPLLQSKETVAFDPKAVDAGPAWLSAPRDAAFYSFDNPYYGWLDTGVHLVNFIRYATGCEPTVAGSWKHGGMRTVQLDFAGSAGSLEFCVNFAMKRWEETTELHHERATLRIETPPPLDMQTASRVELYREEGENLETCVLGDNRRWAFAEQLESFVAAVGAGRPDSTDLEHARHDLVLIEAIHRNAP